MLYFRGSAPDHVTGYHHDGCRPTQRSPPAPERAPRLAELAAQVAANHPSLMRVGLFGSYGLMPTTTEHAEPLASSSAMAAALQGASRFLWQG